ncbi:MAG: phosphotransferase [Saccharofermentanales bacterium]
MGSKIYKELENNDLQKIVADLYGNCTKIKEFQILKGGLYNTTYLAKTDGGDIVIRVAPINTHLLFDYEKDMMSSEPMLHDLLKNKGIPTTIILKYSPPGFVIDREYIISEYIDSIPMNDSSLSNINLEYIYSTIGSYTRKLHEISNDRFGWKRPDGGKEYSKWSDFILRFAKECVNKASEHSLFTQSDINAFWHYINDCEIIELLDEIKQPLMIHTDLWQGNVLLTKKGEEYSVAAIIDMDRTIFGDCMHRHKVSIC